MVLAGLSVSSFRRIERCCLDIDLMLRVSKAGDISIVAAILALVLVILCLSEPLLKTLSCFSASWAVLRRLRFLFFRLNNDVEFKGSAQDDDCMLRIVRSSNDFWRLGRSVVPAFLLVDSRMESTGKDGGAVGLGVGVTEESLLWVLDSSTDALALIDSCSDRSPPSSERAGSNPACQTILEVRTSPSILFLYLSLSFLPGVTGAASDCRWNLRDEFGVRDLCLPFVGSSFNALSGVFVAPSCVIVRRSK